MTTAAKSITITAFDTVSTTFTDSSGGDSVYDLAIYFTIEMLTNYNGYNELSLAAKKLPMAKIVITKEPTEKGPKISNNA